MPNRYGAKRTNKRARRTTGANPLVRRRPGMRLKGRYAKTRKQVNNRLSEMRVAIKKLQGRTYGETQLADQAFYHVDDPLYSPDSPNIYDLCSEQPVCWCLQAIRSATAVWQLKYSPANAPGARFNVLQIGSFDRQKFLFEQLNADPNPSLDVRFRTTEFWRNSEGVAPKFLLKSSSYEGRIRAHGVVCWVELCLVTAPRNFFGNSRNLNYQIPSALRSFVGTCYGSEDRNVVNYQTNKVKVLKRFYFEQPQEDPDDTVTTADRTVYYGATEKLFSIHVKSNNVISVADQDDPAQVFDYTEIPLEQQSWLMWRTSLQYSECKGKQLTPGSPGPPPVPPTYGPQFSYEGRRLELQLRRVVSWRDQVGNSLA